MVTGDGMPGWGGVGGQQGPRGVMGGDQQAPWNVGGRQGMWRGTSFSNSEEAACMRWTVEPGAQLQPHGDGTFWRCHSSPAAEVGLSVADP